MLRILIYSWNQEILDLCLYKTTVYVNRCLLRQLSIPTTDYRDRSTTPAIPTISIITAVTANDVCINAIKRWHKLISYAKEDII